MSGERVLPGSMVKLDADDGTAIVLLGWPVLDGGQGPSGAVRIILGTPDEVGFVAGVVEAPAARYTRYKHGTTRYAFVWSRSGHGWVPCNDLEVIA